MKLKILVITTKFPFPMTGACEADRASGILQLVRLGFDVRVITKFTKYQRVEDIQSLSRRLNIPIKPIGYKFDTKWSKLKKLQKYVLRFLTNPLMLDGAAFEFNDTEMKDAVRDEIVSWRPNLAWFDYTYTWPLYGIAKKYKLPIIARSLNFESTHFLEENGRNLLNYIRFVPKFFGEIMIARKSDVVFAINPREATMYRKLGARHATTLPLRGLPKFLNKNVGAYSREKINVFFLGSSYNVSHMKKALLLILKDIAPMINEIEPNKFHFNIFGGKFPKEFEPYLGNNVVYRGYVDNLDGALEDMDIALIPSFHVSGMQQKVFGSLSMGFPTITYPESLAGYPFENEKHVLLASTTEEFIEQLLKLQDINLRRNLSKESLTLCKRLFSQEALDSIVFRNISRFIKS